MPDSPASCQVQSRPSVILPCCRSRSRIRDSHIDVVTQRFFPTLVSIIMKETKAIARRAKKKKTCFMLRLIAWLKRQTGILMRCRRLFDRVRDLATVPHPF
jgi:hypothetical protein